mmetsp:Transcript_77706/g.168079  ORF Transcript_77706/g.168079 Transcript_77706/m.168079 type:complete len:82 (+) Transcript_77706:441-686(+)
MAEILKLMAFIKVHEDVTAVLNLIFNDADLSVEAKVDMAINLNGLGSVFSNIWDPQSLERFETFTAVDSSLKANHRIYTTI